MDKFLVEEIHETFDGSLHARFRAVVYAWTFRHAFDKATNKYPEWEPCFGIKELEETICDVLWEAADGSVVMIQVRKLPDFEEES